MVVALAHCYFETKVNSAGVILCVLHRPLWDHHTDDTVTKGMLTFTAYPPPPTPFFTPVARTHCGSPLFPAKNDAKRHEQRNPALAKQHVDRMDPKVVESLGGRQKVLEMMKNGGPGGGAGAAGGDAQAAAMASMLGGGMPNMGGGGMPNMGAGGMPNMGAGGMPNMADMMKVMGGAGAGRGGGGIPNMADMMKMMGGAGGGAGGGASGAMPDMSEMMKMMGGMGGGVPPGGAGRGRRR